MVKEHSLISKKQQRSCLNVNVNKKKEKHKKRKVVAPYSLSDIMYFKGSLCTIFCWSKLCEVGKYFCYCPRLIDNIQHSCIIAVLSMEKYLAQLSDYRDREFRRSHLMSEAKDNLQLK